MSLEPDHQQGALKGDKPSRGEGPTAHLWQQPLENAGSDARQKQESWGLVQDSRGCDMVWLPWNRAGPLLRELNRANSSTAVHRA